MKFSKKRSSSNMNNNESSPEQKVKLEMHLPFPMEMELNKQPNVNLTLKEGIVDIEYNDPGEEASDLLRPLSLSEDQKTDDSNGSKTVSQHLMRDKCTRLGNCKFGQKCFKSQLVGVYSYCNDYQNLGCTRPECKYVHVTVLEKENFYRTGEMPPHAFAHLKKVDIPPPPPLLKESAPNMHSVFNRPPSILPISVKQHSSVVDSKPAEQIDASSYTDDGLRSKWPYLENVRTPRDLVREDQQLQKRIASVKNKLEKIEKARFEKLQTLEMLTRKRERLMATLEALFSPTSIMEQLNDAISTPEVPEIEEDTSMNSFNMTNLLVLRQS